MQHEESFYPSDWLKIAKKDLERTKQLIDLDDPALAGFCLQQSIEKFLKASVISRLEIKKNS
jgi:HEPN domain-containing protein